MAQPYVGEIRMFGGNFAPAGWEFCDGRLVSISENETLFQLIGTTYGGDGQSTFALPDLRGRLPIHQGNGFVIGETVGTEAVTLTVAQLPAHSHTVAASTASANQTTPTNHILAQPSFNLYRQDVPNAALNTSAIASVGGNQPHNNFQPYLCVSFIISLFGIFPSPT